MGTDILLSKDSADKGPVPSAWRTALESVVRAFVRHDYRLASGIPGVAPVSEETATQIREYIEDYGETLAELAQETWDTSVCIWTGEHWDVLVDLWTEEEGSSDLVLQVRVSEPGDGHLMTIHMVYVP